MAFINMEIFLGRYPKRSMMKRIKVSSSLVRFSGNEKKCLIKDAYPLNFLTITDVLCPPNPKVLDIATLTILF